jgi:hypothetical protein
MFSGYENLGHTDLIILIQQFPYENQSDKNLLHKTLDSLELFIENMKNIEKFNFDNMEYITPIFFDDENFSFNQFGAINKKQKEINPDIDVYQEVVDYVIENKMPYIKVNVNKTKTITSYINLNEKIFNNLKNDFEAAIKDAISDPIKQILKDNLAQLQNDWSKQNV